MPNNSRTITRALTGMFRNLHPMNMGEGIYDFMLNGAIDGFDGNGLPVLQNEPSNLLCNNFPDGYKPAGYVNIIEQNRIIWFLADDNGHSEIGESRNFKNCDDISKDALFKGNCDDCGSVRISEEVSLEKITQKPCCIYHTIVNADCLNFNPSFPVVATYNITNCGIDLYFGDIINGRRYLQFEYVNDDVFGNLVVKKKFYKITGYSDTDCKIPIYSTELDCNTISFVPHVNTPCIEFIDLVEGGSNKAGSYQFFVAYSDIDSNPISSYFSSTNIIPVFTKEITFETDYITDKAIALQINNLDATGPYAYYNIAVAKTINNSTAFYLVGTFPITQTKYIYTGNNEAEIKLEPGDIFRRTPFYDTAGAVAISNSILYWANVNESPKVNIQRIANNVKLQWQTIAIPEKVYRDPRNVNKFRSCMRDEVYPYGLMGILDTGEETAVGHIPAPEAKSSDLEIIDNDDVLEDINCAEGPRNKRWQVYNTATVEGGDLQIYKECEETCYQYGNFSYWESIEKYPTNLPDIWGDLCGKPIRHHKYPDAVISHIHNNQNGEAIFADNNIIYPIGVKVDHGSVRAAIATAVSEGAITQALADRIVGYRIVRGNRFGNKSIKCKGLLYDVNQYQRKDGDLVLDEQPIYFANYPFNNLKPNLFVTDQLDNYDDHDTPKGDDLPFTFSKRYTFYSPDTTFSEPTVGSELKLETVEYGEAEASFTKSKDQAKQRLLSTASYALALTGAIVAAMLKTTPVECIEYKVTSDYKMTQDDSRISQASFDTGQSITGTTTGVWAGVVEGELTGSISTVNAGGHIGEHTFSHPDITQDNTLMSASNTGYDRSTGLPGTPKTSSGAPISELESYSGKTCKGTRIQYFNNELLNGNPLGFMIGAINGFLGFLSSTADFLRVMLEEMRIIIDLLESLTPYRDWCIQYNGVGKYNNYIEVGNTGNKRRKIVKGAYLKSENSYINEPVDDLGQFSSIKLNNWLRESSLYLKYDGALLPNAGEASGIVDDSRRTFEGAGCVLDRKFYAPISAYYGAIKDYVPDQYGSIYNVEYMLTDSCYFNIDQINDECKGVYGGDVFIDRFALKIKVPYFLATTFKLPAGVDFDYSEYPNLAFPRHYYNTNRTLGSEVNNLGDLFDPTNIFDILGRPKSIRDCETSKFFYQNGYIYLYSYGIPYFIVESDINVSMRYGENNLEKNFYPHAFIDEWLQETNVPIREDNVYLYNRSYSKQNKETPLIINGPDFQPGRDCRVEHPNRIIYATDGNWFTYNANNFFDYPLSNGTITSIEGIENESVLVRATNTSSVFKSVLRFPVEGQTLQAGNGSVFSQPPDDFAKTKLGYVGSQHRAILNTEFGHIFPDVKRGEIFVVGLNSQGLDELTKDEYGMRPWFKQNLPFKILSYFENMNDSDIDSNFAGLGICMAFDKRQKRIFITKRDYVLKDKTVTYNRETRKFFKGETEIQLSNTKYFSDASWTISFSFLSKTWVGYYSFKPNYYVDAIEFFGSGIDSGFWLHDKTQFSFQVFYGKLYPFIVEPVIKFVGAQFVLNSLMFDTEVKRYNNDFDYTVKKLIPGFNKAILYNDKYNSGLLNLDVIDKNDMSLTGLYPIRNFDSWDIEIATLKYKWNINQFYNLLRDNSELPMWSTTPSQVEKNLNNLAFSYQKDDFSLGRLRGQWFKTRFINDKFSNYKVLYKFQVNNQTSQNG